ncbi:DEAD/DEAH box helicase family protein [Salmonella enterica]|uniref:DEAD/DEAH box helicase family protein n=1 Tax=Salmonella enterica TaxID=28901 RepID=UPI00234FD12A|nr:DEAD/DEAH box helicase family protein [Salmonella enterica]MDC7964706.1 DEAD/DEAH box helicase family protein [Salmonella enterica subsp. enterica serovar 4,[5],12:i:-]
MAGTILYLFKEFGYQNFIFFVHTDAIIQKTRENLLNPQSPKYLFSHELEIDGKNHHRTGRYIPVRTGTQHDLPQALDYP